MTDLPSPQPGQILKGPLFNEPMRVETVRAVGHDTWTVGLVGMQSKRFRSVTLTARGLETLTIIDTQATFNGDGRLLRLGLQAYALGAVSARQRREAPARRDAIGRAALK